MALTATAPPDVRDDIIKILGLEPIGSGTVLFQSPLFRPNLKYAVYSEASSPTVIGSWIKKTHPNQSGIVYCLSRKDTEMMAEALVKLGLSAAYYHADLNDDSRERVHLGWRDGKIKICCATSLLLFTSQPHSVWE